MRLGIMQPYFFPYLGYFSLIKHVDTFILLDDVQFIRHGWIERNRILHPNIGWQYIQVPLKKHSRETKIRDVKINNDQDWKKRILAQIAHYKKIAPFFYETLKLLQGSLSADYVDISLLNKAALIFVCDYLGIHTPIFLFSEMGLIIEKVSEPDDWALNICKALNASEYWNPIGGIDIFDKSKYEECNISLNFLKINLVPYFQNRETFESGLSILDVLMFSNSEKANRLLDDFAVT